MSKWLKDNLSLILLSLVLAFFFWAVATEASDPTKQETFTAGINLEVRGLREGMVYYNLDTTRVWTEIQAPESVWDVLRSADIEAYIDLTDVPTGTVELPVQVDIARNPASVTDISPQSVNLMLERVAEKEVPITVLIQGQPDIGFTSEGYTVAPKTVRIQGPESLVKQVNTAAISISIEDASRDVIDNYEPLLLDQNGDIVPEVVSIPKTATVEVPVWQLSYVRDLSVAIVLEGQPAPGYRIANVILDPPVVKVTGRKEIVENAPGYLQTEPIYLQTITQSLTTQVSLRMLEGLALISPTSPEVTATLSVEVIRSGLTLAITPTLRGLSKEYTATVGIDTGVVILSGPLSRMETLDTDQIELILDLTGLGSGDYSIIPSITVPDGIDIENVIPEALSVKVEPYQPPEDDFR